MSKKYWQAAIVAAPLIILFGLFVYPTLYKYDKLEQNYPVKINRLTGDAEILSSEGWINVGESKAAADRMEAYKAEILAEIREGRESLRLELSRELDQSLNQMSSSIREDLINETMVDIDDRLSEVRAAIADYRTSELDPGSWFGKGSSMKDVEKAMGTPSSVSSYGSGETWFYGLASIQFNDGKVTGWRDSGETLRLK